MSSSLDITDLIPPLPNIASISSFPPSRSPGATAVSGSRSSSRARLAVSYFADFDVDSPCVDPVGDYSCFACFWILFNSLMRKSAAMDVALVSGPERGTNLPLPSFFPNRFPIASRRTFVRSPSSTCRASTLLAAGWHRWRGKRPPHLRYPFFGSPGQPEAHPQLSDPRGRPKPLPNPGVEASSQASAPPQRIASVRSADRRVPWGSPAELTLPVWFVGC